MGIREAWRLYKHKKRPPREWTAIPRIEDALLVRDAHRFGLHAGFGLGTGLESGDLDLVVRSVVV